MELLDILVLFSTLLFIVMYGSWKTKTQTTESAYFLGNKNMGWGTIGLSVMATQASAITFISTTGQGYENGMGFLQNYFGMPFALMVIALFFVPIYYRLKVYTAYEYLEKRFDLKTRLFVAGIFLIQRGLAAGITIYAPSIILSIALGWDLSFTILINGILVIIYTVIGGSSAVSITQKQQMAVIMIGMFVAFGMILFYITQYISIPDAFSYARFFGKLEAIDTSFDFSKRYTIWTGLLGGFFLSLSYFGTDQSQVGRYLTGKNISESKKGLLFNALFKIPMQFFILLTGAMLFVFYQLYQPPLHFKQSNVEKIQKSDFATEYKELERQHQVLFEKKKQTILQFQRKTTETSFSAFQETIKSSQKQMDSIVKISKKLLLHIEKEKYIKDSDYIFLSFILSYLPHGIIGLLIAVIFCAAMSSSSSELNALGTTTTIDFVKRLFFQKEEKNDIFYIKTSKITTIFWGGVAITFALFGNFLENLIEAVNILGSLFYPIILGVFLAGFFLKYVQKNAIFYAAILSQILVIILYKYTTFGYLWYNVIGVLTMLFFALFFQIIQNFFLRVKK